MQIASGYSFGAIANVSHAANAVRNALEKLSSRNISNVLLFLSNGYAYNPQSAITAAAKVASTTLISGCCALEIFSEDTPTTEHHSEGAVALVISDETGFSPAQEHLIKQLKPLEQQECLFSLASPNAAVIARKQHSTPLIGAVTSDYYGHGPYSVWQAGKIAESEYIYSCINQRLQVTTLVSHSHRPISDTLKIGQASENSCSHLNPPSATQDQKSAVQALRQQLDDSMLKIALNNPYQIIAAVSAKKNLQVTSNSDFRLLHLTRVDSQSGQLHFSGKVRNNEYIYFAIRDAEFTQQLLADNLKRQKQLAKQAKFALIFINVARNRDFFDGRQRDLELFKQYFPDLPMVGFFSNAELSPGQQTATLSNQYSCMISFFY